MPALHHGGLVRIVRLHPTLVLSRKQILGVRNQRIAIPEADGVAIPRRVGILGGRVIASVGVDPANVVHHLVDQPRLGWRHDELVQKRLAKPARGAGRAAVADRVVLTTGAGKLVRLGFEDLLPSRRQLCGIGPALRP